MTTETTAKPCGCRISGPLGIGAVLGDGITRVIDGTAYGITYCPLHAAARELAEALRECVKFLDHSGNQRSVLAGKFVTPSARYAWFMRVRLDASDLLHRIE